MKHPKPKNNYLQMCYGKLKNDSPDICFTWGDECSKSDSRLLFSIFNLPLYGDMTRKTPLEELEARGYDITTIEFSIKKKTINEI